MTPTNSAPAETSDERFERAFSLLRSVWKTDRSHQLSKLVWEFFTEEECQAASKWIEDAKEELEQLSYMTGGDGSVDEFPEGPLEDLGTALYLCSRCRPEEMAPRGEEQF